MVPFAKVGVLVVVGVASSAGMMAQDRRPDVAKESQRLLARLGATDERGLAFARLVALGEGAVPALIETIGATDAQAEPARLALLLTVAEEMGPAAVTALEPLWDEAELAEGEALRQILWCIGSLAPHLGHASVAHLQRIQQRSYPFVRDEDLSEDERKRYAVIWFRSIQFGRWHEVELHADRSVAKLLDEVTESQPFPFRFEMAAVLLSFADRRTAEQTAAAIAALRAQLQQPVAAGLVRTGKLSYECAPVDHRRVAGSLLRLEPESAVAGEAHVYLLQHGLLHEQWRALEELRRSQQSVDGYERALRAVAADATMDFPLRQEAVTTLGMLRELAAPSIEVLRKLEQAADERLAVRARAVLRRAGRDGR